MRFCCDAHSGQSRTGVISVKSCPELLRTSKHLLEMRFGANQLKLDPDLTFEIFQECEQPEIYNPSIRDQSAEGGIMDFGLASFARAPE